MALTPVPLIIVWPDRPSPLYVPSAVEHNRNGRLWSTSTWDALTLPSPDPGEGIFLLRGLRPHAPVGVGTIAIPDFIGIRNALTLPSPDPGEGTFFCEGFALALLPLGEGWGEGVHEIGATAGNALILAFSTRRRGQTLSSRDQPLSRL